MNIYKIATIQEHPELKNRAANWFHEKWNIPLEAYLESMEACIQNANAVPQWYVAVSYTHLKMLMIAIPSAAM